MLTWLFPKICPVCGDAIHKREMQCAECKRHFPIDPIRLPIATINGIRIWCTALYPYRGAVREALHRFKFNRQRGRGEGFGALMSTQVACENADLVTFVPMDRGKKRMRGYNQAELLARACAQKLNLPLAEVLHKAHDGGTQHELDAVERERNVADAYTAEPLHGARVVLCDDIVTTGATLRACTRALLKAGASEVHCLCVAWTKGEL